VPGEFDALTLAAWVRVDRLDHKFNALFLTDGFEIGAPHWQVQQDGRLRLGVCHGHPEESTNHYNYDSRPVFTPDQLGQWKHLAVVYDAAAGLAAHYVNGQAVGQSRLRTNVRLTIGNAELGNWSVAARSWDRYPVRNFVGRMDEFLLFRAALSPEDILDLFRAGEPVQ
jgi:hypothetical protein